MATKTINVIKPFTLSIVQDGELKSVPHLPGVQDVEEDVAEHWYTQAHCGELPAALRANKDKKEA
jgi:hypothetical protein